MNECGLSVIHAKAKARLDEKGLDTSSYPLPLYTHADPAEVEALRGQLAAWQALAAERLEVATGLRSQLAEAQALLRECQPCLEKAGYGTWQIDELLSASAEPSAPVEIDEMRDLLKSMTCSYRSAVQAGYDRITGLGGECDSVEKMLSDYPDYARARAALERKP